MFIHMYMYVYAYVYVCMYVYVYVCMYVCMYVCVYIYIYIERERDRERERERERDSYNISVVKHIDMYRKALLSAWRAPRGCSGSSRHRHPKYDDNGCVQALSVPRAYFQ